MNPLSRRGAFPRRTAAIVVALLAIIATTSTQEVAAQPPQRSEAPFAAAASVNFLETFDGAPTTPQPWNQQDWDVVQTSRNRESWVNPDPMSAHHALANCGDVAAGGSHTVDSWPETVFRCNDHVMTSIDGTPGYAAIYLSPPVMADFSAGSSIVGFDVSTFVSSARDWIDVWISPYADAISYASRYDLEVDGSGPPRNGINVVMDAGAEWRIDLVRNGVATTLGRMAIPYSGFGGPSRTTRTPVRIVMRPTSMTLSYPTVPGASKTVNFAALGWNQGVVQFGHHSYTPLKDCAQHPNFICEPDTWHWDNIRINPARPFYQRQANPERITMVTNSAARSLTFGGPAPANAELWFSGNCNVQVRDTATSAWRSARVVGVHANHFVEHTQSFRVTVRPGATSIQFRFVANAWYEPGQGCQLSNPIIKSPNALRGSSLLTWDQASGSYASRVMNDWTFGTRWSGQWNRAFDDVVVGDFDRDGDDDDYVVWDRNTGEYVVWTTGTSSFVRKNSGAWSRVFDRLIVGDFDSDGYVNDVFALDNNTGNWTIFSMSLFTATRRRQSSYSASYETIIVGDWDADGRRDDALLWDTTTGYWAVHSFSAFNATWRSSGRWSSSFERGYAIDCDRDGARDDLLLWDDDTGQVHAMTFSAARPALRATATLSSTLDIGASADLNSDGMWNELFVFDRDARQWQVHSYTGCRPSLARAGTFPVSYDVAWG